MKTEDRWDLIVQSVEKKGFLTVQELSELCDASVITIRRDLTHLDSSNRLRRTHGGAAPLNGPVHPVIEEEPIVEIVPARPDQSLFERLDALVISDLQPKFYGLVQKTAGKRIPIIAESLPLPSTDTCVTVDNYAAGYHLGEWAGKNALLRWNGKINVLDLSYHRPNTHARSQGFLEGLRKVAPRAELVFSINTQSRYDMAYQLTRDALVTHPDINVIFAINDTSARGAVNACKDLGIAPDQLMILTFGMEGPSMIDLMVKGEWLQAGVCMFPEIVGTMCIESAISAYNHEPLPDQLITPYYIATPETITEIYTKTSKGWQLDWEHLPFKEDLPLPVYRRSSERTQTLPNRMGFIYTFVEHDWYKTMTAMMKEYTSRLGIQLELLDFEQTLKDELNLRRNEIARRAAREVNPGDTIFIDAGLFSKELAEQLSSHHNITVITNSLPVIETLKESQSDITLISTGGAFRRASQSFVGPTAENMLKEFRIDKLFLMASGVSKAFGISHPNISEVTIKQFMIHAAREIILLADNSCFQEEALIQVAPINVVHKIITDDALPPSIRLDLGALGISVILATM